MHIIIPCREGSKGLPHKNRQLLPLTLQTIPKHHLPNTIVDTDDDEIIAFCKEINVPFNHRLKELSGDRFSIREYLKPTVASLTHTQYPIRTPIEKTIIVLYTTYPERTWNDVERALEFFKLTKARSLLCKAPVTEHPYLCFYETDGIHGKQVVDHDKYQRQQYPPCFLAQHAIIIFKEYELPKLNANLWNEDTVFFQLEQKLKDVDRIEDL